MLQENQTMVTEFLLLGFQNIHNFRIPLFLLLIIIYVATTAGNSLIISLTTTSLSLQSPMYFFLSHLSLCDILVSTNVTPKTLQVIIKGPSVISAGGWLTQLYFFGASAVMQCCLLTVMSYDCYLAICKPLRYVSIMNIRLPHYLVIWSWMVGFVQSFITTIFVLHLQFCGPNVIDHFFCDFAPLLQLSCSDTSVVQIEVSIAAMVISLLQFLFIIGTYICIFTSILQISSKIVFSSVSISHLFSFHVKTWETYSSVKSGSVVAPISFTILETFIDLNGSFNPLGDY
ncbi:olfactory receptor 10A7-like [Rhinophrynus dorsalis]